MWGWHILTMRSKPSVCVRDPDSGHAKSGRIVDEVYVIISSTSRGVWRQRMGSS